MTRWRLIVSGRVQTAGYRAMVKNIALGLQIKGVVRNLDDGTVDIYCEASQDAFDKFREGINLKSEPSNLFMPSVEKIEVHEEGTENYGAPPDEMFKTFRVDYGEMDIQLETLERTEVGILALGSVRSEVGGVRSDIQAMHTDMNVHFDTLDEKYGAIGQQMNTLTTELQTSTLALVSLTEKIGALIDKKLAE